MMTPAAEVIAALKGKTLATAESCTGGGIGAGLTAIPGSSAVFKGGIISYCDEIKHRLLDIPEEALRQYSAVSAPVAKAMAEGARNALDSDVAVSVTGVAGPGADGRGNPEGLVFIGYADEHGAETAEYHFSGGRDAIREQAVNAAFKIIIQKMRG